MASSLVVQSVLCKKTHFRTRADAKRWVGKNGFKTSFNPDPNPESASFWRFRQRKPTAYVKGSMRTRVLNDAVHLVVGKTKCCDSCGS